ncbi:MAG: hypothetical protein ACC682_15450 [Gemmatimonadota bacterium]
MLYGFGVQVAQESPPGIPTGPPPLPGGLTAVFRWLFQVPQWIQMAGGILGVVVGIAILWGLWKRRLEIWKWLVGRALVIKVGLAVSTLAVVLVFAGFGRASWNYMQNDNDFCTACHIMGPAFQRFADSEHAELNCHDCHQQSIFASARQLHLWILERSDEIAEHAPVPTTTCSECHSTGRDSTWQRVLATAGHRTHMESDSSALAEVMCVTCHGQEVHRFVPANQTCGQAGCHSEEETRIVLGRMTEVTSLHCVSCHEFTRPVAETASQPSARSALTPEYPQCVSCHQMDELLARFDAKSEPHGASCGTCHDPHEQETPRAALVTCAAAGCHDDAAASSPLHLGLSETALGDCLSCHVAHTWEVTGSTCIDCHADILEGGGEPRARSVSMSSGPSAAEPDVLWFAAEQGGSAADTTVFKHLDHADVDCTACHSSERRHGEVTVRTPAQCASCHHAPEASQTCATCHEPAELDPQGETRRDVVAMIAGVERTRSLPFTHGDHADLSCGDCHVPGTAPVASREASSCAGCHAEHHEATATCTTCHTGVPEPGAHGLEVHADLGCGGAGCHESADWLGFVSRGGQATTSAPQVCLACHADQKEHEPEGDCASCHLIPTEPGGW